jgi:hypothetical protein
VNFQAEDLTAAEAHQQVFEIPQFMGNYDLRVGIQQRTNQTVSAARISDEKAVGF